MSFMDWRKILLPPIAVERVGEAVECEGDAGGEECAEGEAGDDGLDEASRCECDERRWTAASTAAIALGARVRLGEEVADGVVDEEGDVAVPCLDLDDDEDADDGEGVDGAGGEVADGDLGLVGVLDLDGVDAGFDRLDGAEDEGDVLAVDDDDEDEAADDDDVGVDGSRFDAVRCADVAVDDDAATADDGSCSMRTTAVVPSPCRATASLGVDLLVIDGRL